MATRQTARKRQPPKAWDAQAVPSRGRKRPASTSRGRPAKKATDLATPTPASGSQTPPTNASELSGTLSEISQTMVAMSSMLQQTMQVVTTLASQSAGRETIQPAVTQLQHSDTMNCNSGAESSTDADVDLTVGDIVSEHINDIMGTNSKPNCPQSNDFVSLALPLDAMISDKLKNKIWGNEFIDLSVLIDQEQEEGVFHLAMSTVEGGAIRLTPNRRLKSIDSIHKWLSAFQIFMAIYCQKHTHEFGSLLAYQNIVKRLASQGGNWQLYDSQFRKLRQTKGLPWQACHWELWMTCQNFRPQMPQQHRQNRENNRARVPRGWCFKYHSGGKCLSKQCNFYHKCYACGQGNHPASKCWNKGTHQKPQTQPKPKQQPPTQEKPHTNTNQSK